MPRARSSPRLLLFPALPALALAALGAGGVARAQPRADDRGRGVVTPAPVAEGTVVAIDSGDLVVDLGAVKGVRDGDVVELWRPLRVRHPVTGQTLNDRFRIGALRLVQVRGTLSLAAAEGSLTRTPATGDVVVVPDAARRASGPSPPSTAPKPEAAETPSKAPVRVEGQEPATMAPAPVAPDAVALGKLMRSLTGADPAMRARAYTAFVTEHPSSPYAKVLTEESFALTRVDEPRAPDYKVSERNFERARAGVAQRYAVELDARFVGAVLHVRRRGAPGYRSVAMASLGPRYWSATLPGDAIAEPGLEYFVEGVPADGNAVAIVGTADRPQGVTVETYPTSVREPGQLAQVALQSEIASFNVKKANDYVFQTEGSVGWRLRDEGIRAVRSGFGVLRGEGGSLRALDELGQPPTSVGLTYGYVEAELATSRTFAVIGRPIIGLRDGGLTGGAQGFLRIGSDLQTNLSLGGEILGTVGQRGIVQLEWRTIPRVPIVLRTEVTNQPSNARDVGARAIAQVGYQFVRDLTIAARVSYQGRTINHAGPGAGLAVSYQW